MYKNEIKNLKNKLKELEKKQEDFDECMSWEEACTYMSKNQGICKDDAKRVKSSNGSYYHSNEGIGLLYIKHTTDSCMDTYRKA